MSFELPSNISTMSYTLSCSELRFLRAVAVERERERENERERERMRERERD